MAVADLYGNGQIMARVGANLTLSQTRRSFKEIFFKLQDSNRKGIDVITVSVRLSNGGLDSARQGPEFLSQLQSLQACGFEGKRLIRKLLADNWRRSKPTAVRVFGTGPDGQRVDIDIPYI